MPNPTDSGSNRCSERCRRLSTSRKSAKRILPALKRDCANWTRRLARAGPCPAGSGREIRRRLLKFLRVFPNGFSSEKKDGNPACQRMTLHLREPGGRDQLAQSFRGRKTPDAFRQIAV